MNFVGGYEKSFWEDLSFPICFRSLNDVGRLVFLLSMIKILNTPLHILAAALSNIESGHLLGIEFWFKVFLLRQKKCRQTELSLFV